MKFFVKSLGCKTNQLEGQIIVQNMLEAGFRHVAKSSEADFYILNSCTVTASADSQVGYLLSKAKRENPSVKTVLVGCVVQAGGSFENADFVLNNQQKLEISEFLLKNKKDTSEDGEFKDVFLKKPSSTRVSIKIQDGCNNACAYCIIPTARGKSRSNSVSNIIKQIEHAQSLGHKEVVLTGIHIGQWGLEWGKNLLYLLGEIEKTKIHRYRLGSLYVNEIDDAMIEFLKNSKKFCPHFHLSLQSMSDKTLKGMLRNYNAQEALNLIEKLHKNFHNPFLGCDIIVGFPNENEEDFLLTYENLKKAQMTKIHVFPYSRRVGTIADKMDNQVKEHIKKDRVKAIIELSNILYSNFIEKNLGEELEIIFENKSAKTALNKGVSANYIEIFVKADENLKGKMQNLILRKNFLLV